MRVDEVRVRVTVYFIRGTVRGFRPHAQGHCCSQCILLWQLTVIVKLK